MQYVDINMWLSGDILAKADKMTMAYSLELRVPFLDIKVADFLTADNVVLVQLQSDTVRIVNGMGVKVVQWDVDGGMAVNFKVMAIIVPQLRADQSGRCGIIHGS